MPRFSFVNVDLKKERLFRQLAKFDHLKSPVDRNLSSRMAQLPRLQLRLTIAVTT